MADKQFYINKISRYLSRQLPLRGTIIRFGNNPASARIQYDRDYSAGINFDNQGNPSLITNNASATGIETLVCRSTDLENFPIYESLGTAQQSASTLWVQQDGGVPQAFILQDVYRGNVEGLTFLSLVPDVYVNNLNFTDNTPLRQPNLIISGRRLSQSTQNVEWTINAIDPGYPPIIEYDITTFADNTNRDRRLITYSDPLTFREGPHNVTDRVLAGTDRIVNVIAVADGTLIGAERSNICLLYTSPSPRDS